MYQIGPFDISDKWLTIDADGVDVRVDADDVDIGKATGIANDIARIPELLEIEKQFRSETRKSKDPSISVGDQLLDLQHVIRMLSEAYLKTRKLPNMPEIIEPYLLTIVDIVKQIRDK